jgi:hypothetical protein
MSAIPQQKWTRGPAKIIPFPVVSSAVHVKRARVAQWVFWVVLCTLAALGGELWSSRLAARTMNTAQNTPAASDRTRGVDSTAAKLAPSR